MPFKPGRNAPSILPAIVVAPVSPCLHALPPIWFLYALAATNPELENDAPKIINCSTARATSCVYPIPGDSANPPAFSSLLAYLSAIPP